MPDTTQTEKRRVANALNAAKLNARDFRLPKDVRQEIQRRDEVEKKARTTKIRVG